MPILLACAVWGREWARKRIVCKCDNMSVVEVINSGYSRDKELIHLLRCMFFINEHAHISVTAVHYPGKVNVRADALSRNDLTRFLQEVPTVDRVPTPIPDQLLLLLVEEQPDWTSPR